MTFLFQELNVLTKTSIAIRMENCFRFSGMKKLYKKHDSRHFTKPMSQKKNLPKRGPLFLGCFGPPAKKKRSVSVEKNDDVFDDVAEPRNHWANESPRSPPTDPARSSDNVLETWFLESGKMATSATKLMQINQGVFLPNWFSFITKRIQNLHHIFMNLQKNLKSTTLEDLNPYKPTKNKL